MKFFLTIAILTSWSLTFGQCPKVPQTLNVYDAFWGTKSQNIMQVPRVAPLTSCRDSGMVYYNPGDSALHWWTGFTDLSFLIRADQGISDSNNTAQLGEPLNQSNNPTRFYQKREIPLNGFPLYWWDTLNNSNAHGYQALYDTSHCSLVGTYKVTVKEQADTNSDAGMAWEYRPRNYGYPYAGYKPNGALATARSWTWGYSQNDAGGLSMPDNVFGGGYNIVNATSRADTGDAALSLRVETSFPVFGEPVFEMHWPELTTFTGLMHRVNSWYMGKTDGRTLWESNLDDHQYKRVVGTNPGGLWMEATSNSGDFGSINLYGTHANSIMGTLAFVDSTGATQTLRGDAGNLEFLKTNGDIYMDLVADGTVLLNYSANVSNTNGVTIVGNPPSFPYEPTAQFAVVSTTKGLLPPRMTTVQKLAISGPAEGLTVYDTTLHQMSYYNGTTWVNF